MARRVEDYAIALVGPKEFREDDKPHVVLAFHATGGSAPQGSILFATALEPAGQGVSPSCADSFGSAGDSSGSCAGSSCAEVFFSMTSCSLSCRTLSFMAFLIAASSLSLSNGLMT